MLSSCLDLVWPEAPTLPGLLHRPRLLHIQPRPIRSLSTPPWPSTQSLLEVWSGSEHSVPSLTPFWSCWKALLSWSFIHTLSPHTAVPSSLFLLFMLAPSSTLILFSLALLVRSASSSLSKSPLWVQAWSQHFFSHMISTSILVSLHRLNSPLLLRTSPPLCCILTASLTCLSSAVWQQHQPSVP